MFYQSMFITLLLLLECLAECLWNFRKVLRVIPQSLIVAYLMYQLEFEDSTIGLYRGILKKILLQGKHLIIDLFMRARIR
ncbi:MAG: hypothetical protein CMB97_01425 [Flavobacteriaceae bacterium]|nr:hypothetical protein [Flavobacteriaceae bacterium]